MKPEEVQHHLEETGALLNGHFLLSSGKHSRHYLQCARLLQHPELAEQFGQGLANLFADVTVDAVISPAIGGLIIGHETARALNVPFVFSERESGVMTFRRGLQLEKGSSVLAVEDVVTTGGSVKECMAAAEKLGARIAGVGSIIDRGGAADFGIPFRALLKVSFPVYDPDDLPEDLQFSNPIKPGSRVTPD